jgi:putative MATE family efflux protein
MVDAFFIGRINTSATAAIGIVLPLMGFMQALGFTCGQGTGTYLSQKLGAGKRKEAEQMASTGFYFSILLGLLFMVTGLAFLNPLLGILGTTETIRPYAHAYASIILFGFPRMMSALVLNNQLRYQGSAFFSMVGIVSGVIINVILDPIFIFPLHMEIKGAALATIISQFVSFLLLLHGCTMHGNLRHPLFAIKLKNGYISTMLALGSPSFFRNMVASISTIVLNFCAGKYGDTAIAALSIDSRLSFFGVCIIIGLGQGFQPVCGFNYGAKKFKRLYDGYQFCTAAGVVVGLVMMTFCWIFPRTLVQFFRNDPDVIRIGAYALRAFSLAFPILSFNIVSTMLLQVIGKSLKASIASIARMGLFLIPLLIILTHFLGLRGIQIAQPISDYASTILAYILVLPELSYFKKQTQIT